MSNEHITTLEGALESLDAAEEANSNLRRVILWLAAEAALDSETKRELVRRLNAPRSQGGEVEDEDEQTRQAIRKLMSKVNVLCDELDEAASTLNATKAFEAFTRCSMKTNALRGLLTDVDEALDLNLYDLRGDICEIASEF